MEALLGQLADILEEDAVQPGDVLADFAQWDSLSVLSIIAMVDSKYHVNLSANEVNGAKTVETLYKLIEQKQSR